MCLSCDIGTLRALFSLDHCLNTGPTIVNEGDDARVKSLGPVIHRCCTVVIPIVNPFLSIHISRFLCFVLSFLRSVAVVHNTQPV